MLVTYGVERAAAGIVLGTFAALGASRVLVGTLVDVSSHDPLIFIGVALLLGFVASIASWIPALRAARVDPMMVIRAE